jgi:hypothetical protein
MPTVEAETPLQMIMAPEIPKVVGENMQDFLSGSHIFMANVIRKIPNV